MIMNTGIIKHEPQFQSLTLEEIEIFRHMLDMVKSAIRMHPNDMTGPIDMLELATRVELTKVDWKKLHEQGFKEKSEEEIISMVLWASPKITHFSYYRYDHDVGSFQYGTRFVLGVKCYRDTTGLSDAIETKTNFILDVRSDKETRYRLELDFKESKNVDGTPPAQLTNSVPIPILMVELDEGIKKKKEEMKYGPCEMCGKEARLYKFCGLMICEGCPELKGDENDE